MCWFNWDSDKKVVSFYFKQEGVVSYLDKDDVSIHYDLLKEYQ